MKVRIIVIALSVALTGCAGRDTLLPSPTERYAKVPLAKALKPKVPAVTAKDLTPVNMAFAKSIEEFKIQSYVYGIRKMSSKQLLFARELAEEAEWMEPESVIKSRIDELETIRSGDITIRDKNELDGLHAKVRARIAFRNRLENLHKPIAYGGVDPLCVEFMICN